MTCVSTSKNCSLQSVNKKSANSQQNLRELRIFCWNSSRSFTRRLFLREPPRRGAHGAQVGCRILCDFQSVRSLTLAFPIQLTNTHSRKANSCVLANCSALTNATTFL